LKRFKHFCFSQLIVPQRKVNSGRLEILSPAIEWYVAMPVEASLQHLVVGMFEKREFYIEREENRFVVEQVETLPDLKWERRMTFRMLSPVTVSTMHERNGRLLPEYLLANDHRLNDLLRQNILNKYRSLYGEPVQKASFSTEPPKTKEAFDGAFCCTLDSKFIASRGGPEKISKLITIKQGREDETKVRGFMCPVTIEGNPALIALAYESGLGEKNSLGFGMLEVV
ncbi:MAG: CRISPR-associated endoribonuclease Cas6, partial [Terriglobia bacterium]